jgi:hypothetical protein
MATTSTRRSSIRSTRNTRTGGNAMNIQRKINRDYVDLGRDYKKLAVELWQIPLAKFVLGGAALGVLVATFRKYPELDTFLTDNVQQIKSTISDALHSSENLMS